MVPDFEHLSISKFEERPDYVEIRKFLVHVGIGYIGEKSKNQKVVGVDGNPYEVVSVVIEMEKIQ